MRQRLHDASRSYFGWLCCATAVAAVVGLGSVGSRAADDSKTEAARKLAAQKEALAALQSYVGGWRGAGQLKRGSTAGAWSEESDWAWQFGDGAAALVFQSPKGKYFTSGRLTPGAEPGSYQLSALLPDGKTRETYTGQVSDDRFVLKRDADAAEDQAAAAADRPAQITLRLVAGGDRLIVLFEKQLPNDRLARLSEVGYTRKGSGFGQGQSFPECVVTGGYGTMTVEYKGVKYPICCEGCRDLFTMDPEGTLAEYRARKEEERNKPKR